jgi:hypothetical protein
MVFHAVLVLLYKLISKSRTQLEYHHGRHSLIGIATKAMAQQVQPGVFENCRRHRNPGAGSTT